MSNAHPSVEQQTAGFGLMVQTDGLASHKLIRMAMAGLTRLPALTPTDSQSLPGCGLLLQKPDLFFRALAETAGWNLSRRYAVGMLFLSPDPVRAAHSRRIVEQELARETLSLVGWRSVPINPRVLDASALSSLPRIEQVFVNAPPGWVMKDLDRRLYVARRRIETRLASEDPDCYVVSLSNQVIVYKAVCQASDVNRFYLDLADVRLQSAICLFHKGRLSPGQTAWRHVQPYRFLAHSGDITTLAGNREWAQARAYKFSSPLLPDLQSAAPFVDQAASGAASLDNMLELFLAGGLDLFRAVRLLVPPAWSRHPDMDAELKAFYDFNSMHMEPWEGPAALLMSDGRFAACALDRSGRRPARYLLTRDKLLTLASEIGIWDFSPDEIVEKGRVGAGELFVVDTYTAKVWTNFDIDNDLKHRHPYQEWLAEHRRFLQPFDAIADADVGCRALDDQQLRRYQQQFAYDADVLQRLAARLAPDTGPVTVTETDPVPGSAFPIYAQLQLQVAQLTATAFDPRRERHLMSLTTCIGREQNVFNETYGHAHRLQFASPILQFSDMAQLRALDDAYYPAQQLAMTFARDTALASALDRLCQEAIAAVQHGTVLLILSDRDINADTLPIPAPLATAAVQQALVQAQLRCDCNLIIETASAYDVQHFAVLLACGATAIYPYLAYESLARLIDDGHVLLTLRQALYRYRQQMDEGLYATLARLGIGSLASFRCARLFDASQLAPDVMQRCFPGLAAETGPLDFHALEQQLRALQQGHQPPAAVTAAAPAVSAVPSEAALAEILRHLLPAQAQQAGAQPGPNTLRLTPLRRAITPQRLLQADEIEIDLVDPGLAPHAHRDCGSLGELADLIADLHQLNPGCRIALRLLAQPAQRPLLPTLLPLGLSRLTLASSPQRASQLAWLRQLHRLRHQSGAARSLQLQVELDSADSETLWQLLCAGADSIQLGASTSPARRQQLAAELYQRMTAAGYARLASCIGQQAGLNDSMAVARPANRATLPEDQGALRQQLRLELMGPISAGVGGEYHFAIDNRDRTVGSWLAGLRLRHHPEATASSPWLTLYFDGSAGRGFGSWNVDGIHLVVTGDANDLVGRGMGGGQIVVRAHPGVAFDTTAACLLGQACLYGASGGTLFAAGRAGDHFAAANQGASAVVEGVGDHACEGMSAGTIVILGQTGINPGAGLVGGELYVYDPHQRVSERLLSGDVDVKPLPQTADVRQRLMSLLQAHHAATGSPLASELLADIEQTLAHFVWLAPRQREPGAER